MSTGGARSHSTRRVTRVGLVDRRSRIRRPAKYAATTMSSMIVHGNLVVSATVPGSANTLGTRFAM